jgi:hypothetical protein
MIRMPLPSSIQIDFSESVTHTHAQELVRRIMYEDKGDQFHEDGVPRRVVFHLTDQASSTGNATSSSITINTVQNLRDEPSK